MPETPAPWRRWWTTGTDQDVEGVQLNFWGGNSYWGGKEFASSVYPAGKDYGFWEKLAEQRRTGKLDKEFADKWFAQFAGDQRRGEYEPAKMSWWSRQPLPGRPYAIICRPSKLCWRAPKPALYISSRRRRSHRIRLWNFRKS